MKGPGRVLLTVLITTALITVFISCAAVVAI